ncbi:MAG: hypothetical protein AB1458_15705 [Bacteroidota bacterium]
MKKICILLLFFACARAQGQQIISMQISPASPLTSDTIYIYVNLQFPNTGCDGTAFFSQSGNTIYANALHCMGAGMAICNDTDTIRLNPQPQGSYTCIFTLDAGYGTPFCTPGFQPYDYDTLTFTVSSVTGLPQTDDAQPAIYPLPAADQFVLDRTLGPDASAELRNHAGQKVKDVPLQPGSRHAVSVADLPAGVYYLHVKEEGALPRAYRVIVLKN